MKALDALQLRNATAILSDPAPSQEQLDELFKAALRAPDHGALRPWRFITIEGEARQQFSDSLSEIKQSEGAPERDVNKAKKMALRAPMIIVSIASLKESAKIPDVEQDWSAAAATQNILVAAEALGLGAIWRTGWPAFNEQVNKQLGLTDNEKIIGFIYIGQSPEQRKPLEQLNLKDFVSKFDY